jgi:hypothetical protein
VGRLVVNQKFKGLTIDSGCQPTTYTEAISIARQ